MNTIRACSTTQAPSWRGIRGVLQITAGGVVQVGTGLFVGERGIRETVAYREQVALRLQKVELRGLAQRNLCLHQPQIFLGGLEGLEECFASFVRALQGALDGRQFAWDILLQFVQEDLI